MRFSPWALTAFVLLAEASLTVASALLHVPSLGRRAEVNGLARRAFGLSKGDFEQRSPQQSTNTGDLTLSEPAVEHNVSTLSACTSSLQGLAAVTNEAGFAACYNVLNWQQDLDGMFQADLRLFQFSSATEQFANVPLNDITVQLNYPNSTQFSIVINSRRSLRLSRREQNDTGLIQIQQYSLVGNFKMQLDTTKLNSTELMSLLIPQINLQASVHGTTISTNVTSSDTVYFVAGEFQNEATPQTISEAANPLMAVAAIASSKGFVLPGTRLGIFPVGLIVTAGWTFLFLLAFCIGTVSRMRHRDVYRRRVAATTARPGKK